MASHLESLRTTAGQDHDRLTRDETLTLPRSISTPIAGGPGGDPIESTAAQKMLSATTGSLLTALLMTPLDVVRIRWQSQALKPQATTIATDFQKLAVSTPNAFRPTNLGVTACCREVFFMNNNTDVCLAGPRIGSTGPGVGSGPSSAGAAECAVEQTQQRTFTSTLDGLRKIARNEGVFTLWRGLSPTLLMAIPGNIIYFTGYEWLRSNERSPIARHVRENYAALVAGSAARVIAATAVNPIELFRTRLMASHGESAAGHVRDTFRGLADEVATHGYRSLWRGLTLTFWRDVPFSGMYWLGYETIRGKLTDARERAHGRSLDLDGASSRGRARRRSQSRENHTDTFTDSFIAGAASGAFASVATMPFDVGKTRTQVSRSAATKLADGSIAVPHEERNMVRLLWHIFTTEGMAGLFKGWIPRTLKVAPACAIMISSYEIGKRTFQGANERADLQRQAAERRDVR